MSNNTGERTGLRWCGWVVANSALGGLMWFFLLTEYSIAGETFDVLLTIWATAIGLVAWFQRDCGETQTERNIYRLSAAMAMSIGLFHFLLLPITCLGWLFYLSELENMQLVQQVASPNDRHIAHVYFMPSGAYASGRGRVEVVLRDGVIPGVERSVFFKRHSYMPADCAEYIRWSSDNSFRIVGEPDNIVRYNTLSRFGVNHPILLALLAVNLLAIYVKVLQILRREFANTFTHRSYAT